ncbi:DUF3187 family protein [Ferrimonas balearica]|uniref:DUF3187 family protein n=1 Tax=Ferrimonas balearica TaxID=44012 RepID=UPI001F33B56B|nr:DUF3187 family protein [Ferrimonas balearica]MBY6096045.1 DUF3187 family protein [Ferrimonas balearica]
MKTPQLTLPLLLLVSVTAAANVDYGPLYVKAQSPLQAQSFTPMMRNAQQLNAGEWAYTLSGTIASVWAETPDYMMDYYHNSLDLGLRYAPAERWEIELAYQYRFAADNGLDSLTEGFHDLFGIGQNGRDKVPQDRFYISSEKYGVLLEDFEGETLTNMISGYLGYQWLDQGAHALSTGLGLSYNHVSSGPFALHSFEQLVQANYRYAPSERHRLYLTLGASHRNLDEVVGGIGINDWAYMYGMAYQYRFHPRHSLLLEYHGFSGETDDVNELDSLSHEVLLGYRYHLKQGAIEFTMIENIFNMDNSTDIAFTLAYRGRIGATQP